MISDNQVNSIIGAVYRGEAPKPVSPPRDASERTLYAQTLGLACRFRGLEYVKALVECGVSFGKTIDFPETSSTWSYDYSLSLLERNSAMRACFGIFKRELYLGDDVKIVANDGLSLDMMHVLPIEQRAGIAEYLCENSERAGFDKDSVLLYSVMSGSRRITEVLKKHGARLTDECKTALTEASRGFNEWYELSYMINALSDEEFVPILRDLAVELSGAKLHFTNGIYEENYNVYRKQYRFFDIEKFRFILESFNQKKMNKGRIMKDAISLDRLDCLMVCAEQGWLSQPRKRDEIIAYSQEAGKTEITAWLLDFKNRTADLAAEREKAEKRMMAQLNADPNSVTELKKIWNYEKLEDGTLMITRYKGTGTEIIVPEKIGKDTVTAIGDHAFSSYAPRLTQARSKFLQTVTAVKLPDTIKSIGKGAFYALYRLERINIPDGVLSIGESAFSSCFALKALDIPDSVTEVGAKLLSADSKLESVRLPAGLSEIGDYMFSGCESLKSVDIPKGVKRVGIWGFRFCKALEEIALPDGVEEIAREAFSECENLKRIVLPASITLIKNYGKPIRTPFHGAEGLTAVVEPKSYAEKYCKRNNINYVYPEEDK